MTQIQRIVNYLNIFESITPMDAFMDLGITKLATQISRMIRMGYQIKKTMTKGTNRWGEPVHFMTYSWLKEEDAATSSSKLYQNEKTESMEAL